MRKQATLKAPVRFEGVGIHRGRRAVVEVMPAEADYGRVFVRDGVEIPALVESVTETVRSTVIGREGVDISTIEHLLAALEGFQIDNARIVVEGPEIPILDGSSRPFWERFQEAGRCELEAEVAVFELDRPVVVSEGAVLMLALPHPHYQLEYALHYPHPMLGCQQVTFRVDRQDFGVELAPARTFALWEEVQPLLEAGLAQGGDLENALVIYQDRFSTPLRLEQEPVRHKCLDLLGDLSLLGRGYPKMRVIAVRAGHRHHLNLVRALRQWEEDRKAKPVAARIAGEAMGG